MFCLEVTASSREGSLQPSAMSHSLGRTAQLQSFLLKGNFQAKGTVGLLEDTSELLSN